MVSCPGINNYTSAETYNAAQLHSALGSVASFDAYWTDAGSVKHKAKVSVVKMRAIAAISGLGIPVSYSYNATYGRGVTGTYAAADLKNFFGLTISATAYAAGDLMWVQFAGPTLMAVAGIGAIAIGAQIQHNASGTSVKTVTDADNAFGVLQGVVIGGDATIPAGDIWLTNKMGFSIN